MSESMRISRLLSNSRGAQIQAALERAKGISGSSPCSQCGVLKTPVADAPLSGTYLTSQTASCTGFQGTKVGLESTRIALLIQSNLDAATSALDADTRFVQYRGPFIPPVCPTVSLIDSNANIPKQSLRNCPLGNKFYLPTLPA